MDYISITLNAVFTGLGVAIGNEVYAQFKEHRAKLKKIKERFVNGDRS
jgi:hypothetical protein